MKLIAVSIAILTSSTSTFCQPVIQMSDGIIYVDGEKTDYPPVADPDGGGWYFGLRVYGGYVVTRYDAGTGKATETGIPGIPLGTAFNGRSLVIEDEDRLLVIREDTYETEGVAGGKPVAFFGGGSQVFLRYGTINIGNLYEGKSSRVDFDLGDFADIYFYPISLKEIYFQIIRRDGTDETYKIEAEKGGFEVSPVEGSGLIIDMESRYSYFGG